MGLGLVSALRLTGTLSKRKGWTSVERLFTSRHHATCMVWWNLSPLPVHGVESRCWRQLRDALYIAGTSFIRTFPQLWSPPPSCPPREKWCTSQKQREVFFDLPRHPPPKVRNMTASNNSPPPGPKGWTCLCGCPTRCSNKSNWTVHQWHFRKSAASFPWLVQTVCLLLVASEIFDLEENHNYRSWLWATDNK